VPDPIRIVLLDDHVLVREALARLLESQPGFQVVGQAGTIRDTLDILRSGPVDLVLLDINLGPEQGGIFVRAARAEGYQGRILVVTAGVGKIEAARLLQRGCAGIFLKNEKPSLLIEKIHTIMSAPEIPVASAPETPVGPAPVSFTSRERQVLQLVYQGRTNKEIASDLGISEPLVKAFVQQLFSKTGVRNRAQLVRLALERFWEELDY
jgi:two-component system nitrate/nitrite response regulator NarL